MATARSHAPRPGIGAWTRRPHLLPAGTPPQSHLLPSSVLNSPIQEPHTSRDTDQLYIHYQDVIYLLSERFGRGTQNLGRTSFSRGVAKPCQALRWYMKDEPVGQWHHFPDAPPAPASHPCAAPNPDPDPEPELLPEGTLIRK